MKLTEANLTEINTVARASVATAARFAKRDDDLIHGLMVALIWSARTAGVQDARLLAVFKVLLNEAEIVSERKEKSNVH